MTGQSLARGLVVVLCLSAAMPQAGAAGGDAERLLADLDADGDGLVTRQEVGAQHRPAFERLLRTSDGDRDGRLDAEELAAGLTPVRAEKSLVRKQGSRTAGGDALLVLLARMDANGDRQLIAAEIPERYRDAFERMLQVGDDNKDGRLASRELARQAPQLGFVALATARRLGIDVPAELARLPQGDVSAMERMNGYVELGAMLSDPAMAGETFSQLDANGDGLLAADEAPPRLAERFDRVLRRADRDGDGRLSKPEYLGAMERLTGARTGSVDSQAVERQVQQWLDRFDADGDRKLSRSEASWPLGQIFARADRNGDGLLDVAEMQQSAAAFERVRRQFRGAGSSGFSPPAMDAEQPSGAARPPRQKP